MYNFLCRTALIFLIHILFTKKISTFWSRWISSIRGINTFFPKYQTRKADKTHKDFPLNQLSMHNILGETVLIFTLYITYEKNQHNLTKEYSQILAWGYRDIWGQQHYARKLGKIHKECIKFSCTIFCPKMSQYLHIVYYWLVLKAFLFLNWFYFFFIIFWQASGINYSFILFKCLFIIQCFF